jgi:hypothetical protein
MQKNWKIIHAIKATECVGEAKDKFFEKLTSA